MNSPTLQDSPWQRLLDFRHVWLLAALVLLLVLYPFSLNFQISYWLLEVFFILVLLACVFSAADSRLSLVVAIVFALPSLIGFLSVIGFSLAGEWSPDWIVWVRLAMTTGLLIYSAAFILVDVLRSPRINADEICAAVSVYLLLGLIWALFYSMAYEVSPECMAMPDVTETVAPEAAGLENFTTFTYFSFVTLSTLGYGEIVPMSAETRMLAWVEAMFGQIYLAVLIGRVLGLHVAAVSKRRGDSSAAKSEKTA